jgi:hypothetical protein
MPSGSLAAISSRASMASPEETPGAGWPRISMEEMPL